MENEYIDDGVEFGQILKVMFKNKIRWLIGFFATTVVVFIVLFFYSTSKKTYTTTYTYNDVYLTNGTYADGSTFSYLDIYNYLSDVTESNEKYKDINIDDMLDANKIEISYEDGLYTLTISSKLVSNDIAKEFISDLVYYPISKNIKYISNISYSNYLNLYSQSKIYSNQINYLQEQIKYLQNQYESLLKLNNNNNNYSYTSHLNAINAYINENPINALSTEIVENGYVKDLTAYQNYLKSKIYDLNIELKNNKTTIVQLENEIETIVSKVGSLSNANLDSYNSQIATLKIRNVEIESQLEIYNSYLNTDSKTYTDAQLQDFENRLNNYKEKIESFTNTFAADYKEIVESSSVLYNTASKLTIDGGMSTIMVIVVSFIAGIVVACIINLCCDYKLLKEDKNESKNLKDQKTK